MRARGPRLFPRGGVYHASSVALSPHCEGFDVGCHGGPFARTIWSVGPRRPSRKSSGARRSPGARAVGFDFCATGATARTARTVGFDFWATGATACTARTARTVGFDFCATGATACTARTVGFDFWATGATACTARTVGFDFWATGATARAATVGSSVPTRAAPTSREP